MSRPAAVLIVFLALVVPGRAQAGSYTVDACGFGVGAAQNSWTVEASTPLIEAYNICAGGSNDGDEFISHAGFGVRTQRSASLLPGYASAYWRFDAPTGAKIIGLRTNSADRVTQGPEWRVVAEDNNQVLGSCDPTTQIGGESCGGGPGGDTEGRWDAQGSYSQFPPNPLTLNADWVRIGVRCVSGGCFGPGGASTYTASSAIYAVRVRLREDVAPVAQAPSGPIAGGSFSSGRVDAVVGGSDGLGVQSLELLVDGVVVDQRALACDSSRKRPCADAQGSGSASVTLGVSVDGLAEGAHQARTRVTDAAGNVATSAGVAFSVVRERSGSGGGASPLTSTPAAVGVPSPTRLSAVPTATPTPTPVVAPAGVVASRLSLIGAASMRGSRVRLTGKITRGCRATVKVRVTAHAAAGHRRRSTASVVLPNGGRWTVNARWPSGASPRRSAVARVTAATTGCKAPNPVTRTIPPRH